MEKDKRGDRLMIETVNIKEVRDTAEAYYRDGDFYCSEAIIKTVKDAFELPIGDEVVAAASGFPVGIGGAGCTCGAISGGVMALGLFFGRTEGKDPKVNKAMALACELHEIFKAKHKSLCCKVLTKGMTLGSPVHMEQCIDFTGEVAEEVARLVARELDIKIIE